MKFTATLVFMFSCSSSVLAQPDAFTFNPTARDTESCPLSNDNPVTIAITEEIRSIVQRELVEVGTFENPATSCHAISEIKPSGYYWIQTAGLGSPVMVYCDMDRTCNCNDTGGWMRVANLNMTDPNQQCPSGFRLVESTNSSRRSCGSPNAGCISTTFPVYGVKYSKVCGRVIGYQFGSTDAFRPSFDQQLIDGVYVDGVVLTHGFSSAQTHIWTFAAAADESGQDLSLVCPCTNPELASMGSFPPMPIFVGQHFFCETGSRVRFVDGMFYADDPLWDGQGCGANSTCCDHPLYFCKQLPQPTTDDIELRICHNQMYPETAPNGPVLDEDTPIEIVEMYVQ